MRHALVTIVAPLYPDRVGEAEEMIDRLGNPAAEPLQAALDRLDGPDPGGPGLSDDRAGTHFASLHALRSVDGQRAYLVLEFSADGTETEALARIVRAIGGELRPVFMLASDWRDGGDLPAYLRRHRVAIGSGWFDNPGLGFVGTPGMTVGRIRGEAHLAAHIAGLLADQPGDRHALQRIADVRARLERDGFAAALTPASPEPPFEPPSRWGLGTRLVLSFVATYLWPVVLLILGWTLYRGFRAASPTEGFRNEAEAFLGGAWDGFWCASALALLTIGVLAGLGYALLRRAEARDPVEERAPDRATNAALFERENRTAQNHMISVTQRKPGLLRWFTSRLVFWLVGHLASTYRPGFLGDIGTIHFARWVTAPRSPDVLFLSNYDSSWESYLEDFITRAHAGLTAVWSNSIGFPRSENLFQRGATDGERFKRYARRSMVPTRFWYGAYPSLTTTAIRTNAEVRRGLSGVMTEDEAMRWLALFGSAARPASKLVSSEIQSLVLGGLIFMPYGTCLVFDLPEDPGTARAWLRSLQEHLAFNDGRRLGKPAVVTLALGPRGLGRLGLPSESLATFPFAFLNGMTTEARARILGDVGANARKYWRWGKDQPDVALLVYGASEEAADDLTEAVIREALALGVAEPHRIPLKPVSRTEPFGFADGISQPVIRGTHKALRAGDRIHLLEPGEFVLGYPDNRNNIPPGPTLPATADPQNLLPLVGGGGDFGRTVVENERDLGFNGSFLVIRELEQDVPGFWRYCEEQAEQLSRTGRLSPPYVVTAEFIAAKLVGRWPDGSSIVRHPYQNQADESADLEALAGSPHRSNAPDPRRRHRDGPVTLEFAEPIPRRKMNLIAKSPAQAKPEATTRLETNPADGASLQPPAEPTPENDYLFGTEDPEALRCPFGAHVRRANPRDSFDPGSADQIAISNRHRIIRVGRQYAPAPGQNPGLLFMCLNGDIERQFEFVQQTWLERPSFHGLACEKDPLLGDAEAGACGFTIPSRDGPVRLASMPRFVTTRGGGYFFLPGKRLIEWLSARP